MILAIDYWQGSDDYGSVSKKQPFNVVVLLPPELQAGPKKNFRDSAFLLTSSSVSAVFLACLLTPVGWRVNKLRGLIPQALSQSCRSAHPSPLCNYWRSEEAELRFLKKHQQLMKLLSGDFQAPDDQSSL